MKTTKLQSPGSLKELNQEIWKCMVCPRFQFLSMPGYFPKGAEILFIATNPGQLNKRKSGWDDNSYSEEEDWSAFQQGYAKGLFEAPIGRWIQEGMGGRRDWAFTNVIKCRTPDNTPPTSEETSNCRHWLESQIRMMKPRAIVGMGGVVYNWFDPGISLDRILGKAIGLRRPFFEGIYMQLYHPSYLRYKHDKFSKMYFEKLNSTLSNGKAYKFAMNTNYLL